MDLIERTLQAEPVQAAERPRRFGPRPAVGEPHVIGNVEAVSVVGLDPLDPESAGPA